MVVMSGAKKASPAAFAKGAGAKRHRKTLMIAH
jgi:hypothetical protein